MRQGNKLNLRRDGWPETVMTVPADRGSHWALRVGASAVATVRVTVRGTAGDEQLVEQQVAPANGVVRFKLPAVLAGELLIISAIGARGTAVRAEVGWRAEP